MLGVELPWLDGIERAKVPTRVPTVLTREEAARVLARLPGVHCLIGGLLYGSGLRILECTRLRVKDVEFSRREIVVRDGKGQKDRATMLPLRVAPALRDQMEHAREVHRGDLADGYGAICSRMRWRGSRPAPRANGPGNTSSRPTRARSIRVTSSCGAITSASRRSSAR